MGWVIVVDLNLTTRVFLEALQFSSLHKNWLTANNWLWFCAPRSCMDRIAAAFISSQSNLEEPRPCNSVHFAIPPSLPITFGRNPIVSIFTPVQTQSSSQSEHNMSASSKCCGCFLAKTSTSLSQSRSTSIVVDIHQWFSAKENSLQITY